MADVATKKIRSLQREMTAWRKSKRTAGGRIPERFWRGAIELAKALSPEWVCRELMLPEPQLRKRLGPAKLAQVEAPAFVEILVGPSRKDALSQPQSCTDCVIKVEAASGARMQVEVGKLAPSGLATILREFAN